MKREELDTRERFLRYKSAAFSEKPMEPDAQSPTENYSTPLTLCATNAQGVVTLFKGRGVPNGAGEGGGVVGRTVFEVYEGRAGMVEVFQRALAGEQVVATVEEEGRILEAQLTPVFDEGKGVAGITGVLIDVTESRGVRRALEEERLKRTKLESLGVLAHGIAHDFNNVLTGVLGNLSLAQMELDPDTELAKNLKEIERGCLRTRDIVAELGELSQESGPVRKALRLEPCIRQAVRAATGETEVRCGVRVAPDLWSVAVEEAQIGQALQALLTNARQATRAGGIMEIDAWNTRAAEALRPGRYVAIRVTDHGAGIPKDALERIFEPHFTTKEGAQGLGLATARSMVENHGGALGAESTEGAGARFTVYLPASMGEAPSPKRKPRPAITMRARILVMDDEQTIRNLTGKMLASAGYQVETANEGEDAVRKYQAAMDAGNRFDVVVLDLRVPLGMGGFEAFKAIREIDPGVKAIISSGHTENPIMSSYREHGIADVVPKPYRVDELVDAVRRTVSAPGAAVAR